MTRTDAMAWRGVSLWACAGLLMSARVMGEPPEDRTSNLNTLPAQSSRERAREYFVRGGEAASRRSWRDAIELYLESYVHHPHPSTLHNIGYCYHQKGDIYQALFFSARALYEVPQDGVSRLTEANERAATTQLAELKRALGQVVLSEEVTPPKPAWVHVNGTPVTKVPLGRGVWGMVPMQRGGHDLVHWESSDVLLLMEGTHRVSIHDGTRHQTVSIDVIAGTQTWLRFEPWPRRASRDGLLQASLEPSPTVSNETHQAGSFFHPSSASKVEVPHLGVDQPERSASLDDSRSGWRNAAYTSWVASGAAFGFSAVAWTLASDLDADLGAACISGRCPPTYEADVARYDNTVVASYLGLGVGVVSAAAGGLFWVLGSPSNDVSLSANFRRLVIRSTF